MFQTGSPSVPVRNAVGRRIFDVEIAGRPGSTLEQGDGFLLIGQRVEKLQLLGKPAHCPGEPTRPGAEGGVTLLRVRAAEMAIVGVENTLMRGAPADIVRITALAVIDRVLRRGARVG